MRKHPKSRNVGYRAGGQRLPDSRLQLQVCRVLRIESDGWLLERSRRAGSTGRGSGTALIGSTPIWELLVIHPYLAADHAFPRIEPKERENLELEESLPVFTAESIGGTAFATVHGAVLSKRRSRTGCFPETGIGVRDRCSRRNRQGTPVALS